MYHKANNWGRFIGEAYLRWKPEGEEMVLLADFAYVDPNTVEWKATAGTSVNGASIPRSFWPVIGHPYEGNYRLASVLHDAYCESRTRTWEATHFMFYQAMMAAGTDHIKAKTMYYAVYWFGPRWGRKPSGKGVLKDGYRIEGRKQNPRGIPQSTVDSVVNFVKINPSVELIRDTDPEKLISSKYY
jgi:hypothetical protein